MTSAMLDAILEFQRNAQTESLDFWQSLLNAPKLLHYAQTAGTKTAPHEAVYQEGSLKLLHYHNDHSTDLIEPVLLCSSLINRSSILDLQPERSVVRQLLKRGFDVYLIDWGIPSAVDRTLRLQDYVCGLMKNVADFVCDQTASGKLNLLGCCMGGTMSAIFTSLYQDQVKNLILVAAPIDFSGDEGLLNLWTREEYFDVDAFVDAFGNCPRTFLRSSFQMMEPVQNFVEKYMTLFDRMENDDYLESFFAIEQWMNDNVPVAGETFREFVKQLYQKNQLVNGEMKLRNEQVLLQNITCPLLTLTADQDRVVPPGSTLAINEFIASQFVRHMSIDVGHFGLAVSSKAHRELWPEAVMWIADHSTNRQ
jgi:poly[(R)-3-hydroxyalkanoate] polymerase subunit PhaC